MLDWADVTACHLRLVQGWLDWEDVAADPLDWIYSLHARVVSVLCTAEVEAGCVEDGSDDAGCDAAGW